MARFDVSGLLWNDTIKDATKHRIHSRPMPEIPETGWTVPQGFPNLTSATLFSIDTETYDPFLVDQGKQKACGPGWARGSGHVVGFSIGAKAGSHYGRWYFPIKHEVEPQDNLDPDTCLRWLAEILADNRPKVGANLIYDIGWLRESGVEVSGPLYDVQFAEALLNSEAPSVAMEDLAQKYLGMGKEGSLLYEWCADYYGGPRNGKQRKNIYRAPPRLVGPYGEADADLPMRIMEMQWPLLAEQDLLDVFNMECGLIRLLIEMRYRGAPIDIPYVEQLVDQFEKEIVGLDKELKRMVGFEVNVNAAASLAKVFEQLGLWYPRTEPTKRAPNGNPSFKADFLEGVDHPVAQMIVHRRQKTKLTNTFLKSYLLKNHVDGRVFCQFHPLKGDTNGARSGRFASSDPNLQNIPIRTEEGKRIRRAFKARGQKWRKFDHSQIEYRMLAHHAVGPGAEDIRQRYSKNPNTDYHDATIDLIHKLSGLELDRRPAKTINFGLIYGMSQKELQRRLGLADNTLFKSYHEAVPFARETMKHCMELVGRDGYITTVLGRRSHFDTWIPANYDKGARALPIDQALREYGQIQRAFQHKALNRRLQGGAADVMKKGMLKCFESGVFAYTGIPSLTVHDELDFDDEFGNDKAFAEMVHILETCLPKIRVPLRVEESSGPNWGDAD